MVTAALAVAIGVWWNANTVSHLFIHRPFFRTRSANAWFAAALTALLGFPQGLWRDRHIAHHRGADYRFRLTREIAIQAAVVASLWIALAVRAPVFFAAAYVPGYVAGLALCAIHGHYEHAGGTVSHYGRLYNWLCFNDGYHVEHHLHPSAKWWALPSLRERGSRSSAWPAPLRWLGGLGELPGAFVRAALAGLERLVTRSRVLQRYVITRHARAFAALLASAPPPERIVVIGGGLFPRTAIVLSDLFPRARLTVVDADATHLASARRFLVPRSGVAFVHSKFLGTRPLECDLAVFPLALDGQRGAIYESPPAPAVLIHDWIWHRRGTSRVVSPLLLKRVNLVRA
jgi:fatty acid desaturase